MAAGWPPAWDNTTRVVEAASGKEISRFEFGENTNLSFSPDGRCVWPLAADTEMCGEV